MADEHGEDDSLGSPLDHIGAGLDDPSTSFDALDHSIEAPTPHFRTEAIRAAAAYELGGLPPPTPASETDDEESAQQLSPKGMSSGSEPGAADLPEVDEDVSPLPCYPLQPAGGSASLEEWREEEHATSAGEANSRRATSEGGAGSKRTSFSGAPPLPSVLPDPAEDDGLISGGDGAPDGRGIDDELAWLVAERERIMEAKVASAFEMFDNMPMGELFSTFRTQRKQGHMAMTMMPRRPSSGGGRSSAVRLSLGSCRERFSADGSGSLRGSRPPSVHQFNLQLPVPCTDLPASRMDLAPSCMALPPPRMDLPTSQFKSSLRLSGSGKALIPTLQSKGQGSVDVGADRLSPMLPGSSFGTRRPSYSGSEKTAPPRFGEPIPAAADEGLQPYAASSPTAQQCPLCAHLSKDLKCVCCREPEQALYNGPSLAELSGDIISPNAAFSSSFSPHECRVSSGVSSPVLGRNGSATVARESDNGTGPLATWEFQELTEDGGVALNFDSLVDFDKLEQLHSVLEKQFGFHSDDDDDDDDDTEVEADSDDVMTKMGLSHEHLTEASERVEPMPVPETSDGAQFLTVQPPSQPGSQAPSRMNSFLAALTPRSRPLSRHNSANKLESLPQTGSELQIADTGLVQTSRPVSRSGAPFQQLESSRPSSTMASALTPHPPLDNVKPPRPLSRPSSAFNVKPTSALLPVAPAFQGAPPEHLSLLLPASRPQSPSPMAAATTAATPKPSQVLSTLLSKPSTPRTDNRAEFMRSKKEDLAKAIREQLQAHMAAPQLQLDSKPTSLTASLLPSPMASGTSPMAASLLPSPLAGGTSPMAAALASPVPAPPISPPPSQPPSSDQPPAASAYAIIRPIPTVAGNIDTHAAISLSAEAAAQEILVATLLKSPKQGLSTEAAEAELSDLEKSIKVGSIEGKIKPINIVMLITGTRGDVQPFVGIGLKLKEFGHRVRIASHKIYRPFVEGFGLEFYPMGGCPKVLSEYVVKHRGIMPGLDIKDALKQRDQVKEILYSSWGACVNADPETPDKPFIADAIVANPPAYGHSHCAEKLNCPLHIVFTMPWTPTKAFPSPFARIKTVISDTNSKAREVMNWLSYFAMEDLAWLGMSGMVKDFRQRVLGLKTWNKEHTSHALYHSKVPFTYIWSPSLVGRPKDWPSSCEVVGFINLEVNKLTKYKPPQDLADFLNDGPPPVYIGFGSLVVSNPAKLTQQFMEALRVTGLRAIIQKGWGGLGAGVKTTPNNVFLLEGNCAHDWLFEHCGAVIHHGGAGTTATGLYAGKPTFIVYFFGDQPFWGTACHKAGVGPEAVGIDDLNTAVIVDALKELILPTRLRAAKEISAKMHREDGISATVDHLHRTIYGALVGGKSHMWMKQNVAHSKHIVGPATAIVEEGSGGDGVDGEGHLRGFLAMPSTEKSEKSMPASRSRSAPIEQRRSNPGQSDTAVYKPGGRPPVPLAPIASSLCSRKGPQVVDPNAKRKGGFFALFGC